MVFERKTIVSEKVFELLSSGEHALSAQQILETLAAENMKPNRTTVYRILEKLVDKDIVTMITLKNGVSYYELAKEGCSHNHHHHHFFCNSCELVFCLSDCHVETHKIDLTGLLPNKKFKISNHDFNLYGTCESCVS